MGLGRNYREVVKIYRFISVFLIMPVLAAEPYSSQDFSDDWHRAGDNWQEKWDHWLSTTDSMPHDKKMVILSHGVRLGSWYGVRTPTEEQMKVYRIAASKLMEVPGHAEYFGKRIRERYEKIKSMNVDGYDFFVGQTYQDFQTLSLLPSVESVKVLGSMLEEDWNWPSDQNADSGSGARSTLGMIALGALSRLPIANPPSKPEYHSTWIRENLGTWSQWYREVERGRRTFRFIGDPVDYDLRGPSKRGALEPGVRIEKHGVRELSDSKRTDEQSTTAPSFFAYILSGIVLIGSFSYYVYRRRMKV